MGPSGPPLPQNQPKPGGATLRRLATRQPSGSRQPLRTGDYAPATTHRRLRVPSRCRSSSILESPIVGVVRSRSRCDFGIMLLPPATPSSLRMGSFIFGALEREVWVPHPHPGAAPTMALLPHPHPQHGKARAVCENERLGNCGCGMWLSKMAPTLTPLEVPHPRHGKSPG